jgi:hypothetical protein
VSRVALGLRQVKLYTESVDASGSFVFGPLSGLTKRKHDRRRRLREISSFVVSSLVPTATNFSSFDAQRPFPNEVFDGYEKPERAPATSTIVTCAGSPALYPAVVLTSAMCKACFVAAARSSGCSGPKCNIGSRRRSSMNACGTGGCHSGARFPLRSSRFGQSLRPRSRPYEAANVTNRKRF